MMYLENIYLSIAFDQEEKKMELEKEEKMKKGKMEKLWIKNA